MSVASIDRSHSELGNECGCGCGGSCGCGCVPAEFTRLRYAYGLRLGAVELSDEQSYLVGKHRFHNARLHGAGVLCGLKVDQFIFPQGSSGPSTVLRVARGAALDACGREVLVPVDQCIDVNAWFLKNRAQLNISDPSQPLPMRVAIRYRECPSDPVPVPRDPCGCDASGCDYSRVREGFELRLFAGTLPDCAGDVFPSASDLLTALGVRVPVAPGPDAPSPLPSSGSNPSAAAATATPAAAQGSNLATKLDNLTAAACPAMTNGWICLADFTATLDAAGATVANISAPDNTIPGRHVLLSTAALQTLVVGLANVLGAEGVLGAGPSIGGISLANATATSGTLNIAINLITDPGSVMATPLAAATWSSTFVRLFQFDGSSGKWNDVTATAIGSSALSPDSTQISVALSSASSGQQFRLSLISPADSPIVDSLLRPLRPLNYSVSFQLGADSTGNLTLKLLNI